MKPKIITIAHHRNGVSGEPFDIAIFKDRGAEGSLKVAVLFSEPGQCGVLDIAKLATGDITFRSNSWRGDNYETSLRERIKAYHEDGVPLGADGWDQASMTDPRNGDRARWGKHALAAFTAETYKGADPDTMPRDDLECAISDLIADLLHLGHQHGFDPQAILEHGAASFKTELLLDE